MGDSKVGGSGGTGRERGDSRPLSVHVSVIRHRLLDEAASLFVGHPLTDTDIAGLTGALDGATITTYVSRTAGRIVGIDFVVEHPQLDGDSTRSLRREDDGTLTLQLESLTLRPEARGKGTGARILAQEVQASERLGVHRITLVAGGAPGGDMNGYYTWPRLGFNASLGRASQRYGAPDLHTLFRQPGGAEKWKREGAAMVMEFNPRRRSPHRQVLDAYLREKGIRLG